MRLCWVRWGSERQPMKPREVRSSPGALERMPSGRAARNRWWRETNPEDAAKAMIPRAMEVEQQQATRRAKNLRHARLYSNQDLSSIYDCGIASNVAAGAVYLSVNVTQSCVDTVHAKISRSRVRPTAITEKGNRSLKRNAAMLTTFLDGVFQASEFAGQESDQCFVDACLFGSGVAHVYETDDGEVSIERILPDEILVDETQAIYGRRSLTALYRKKYIHRDTLLDLFADENKDLEAYLNSGAPRTMLLGGSHPAGSGDMIPVYQGWKLPSRKDAGDGRFLWALEGGHVLKSGTWKRMRFPFAFFPWNLPTVGLWGRSLAEQLVPIQLKINENLETISDGQRLNCVPRIFVQNETVNVDDFDNLIADVVKTTMPPSQCIMFHAGQGAAPEMYQDTETWIRRAFEITGISMLSATAEKPEGISSAVALRELLDREDMRFAPVGKRWEKFHVDVGWNCIEQADETYESRKKLTVQVPGEKFIERIDWAKVDADRNRFDLLVSPTSALPTTPGAKRQYAQELYEMQAIDLPKFLELIDMPDTRSVTSLLTAEAENIERDIEDILEHGKQRAPEPFMEPGLVLKTALQAYLKARAEGVEPSRLRKLVRYIKQAQGQLAGKRGVSPAMPEDGTAGLGEGTPGAAMQDPTAAPVGAVTDGATLPPDLAAAAPEPVPGVQPVAV